MKWPDYFYSTPAITNNPMPIGSVRYRALLAWLFILDDFAQSLDRLISHLFLFCVYLVAL